MPTYLDFNDYFLQEIDCEACAKRALCEIMRMLPEDAHRTDVIMEVIDTMKLQLQAMKVVDTF